MATPPDASPLRVRTVKARTQRVTARGQVTFRKELLEHLGIKPGEKIEIAAIPGGRVEVRPARKTKKIEDIFGIVKSDRVVSLEEIEKAIQDGWAGLTKWDED